MDKNYMIMVCVLIVGIFGGIAYEEHQKAEVKIAEANAKAACFKAAETNAQIKCIN